MSDKNNGDCFKRLLGKMSANQFKAVDNQVLLRWQDNPYSKGYLAIICPKCGVSVTVRYINLEVDFEHGYCVAVAN